MSAQRFLAAGIINTLVSYLLFLAIFIFSKSVILSLLVGMIGGVALSYSLNKYWVWGIRTQGAFLRFMTVQILTISTNWIALHVVSLTNFPREIAQLFLYILFAFAQFQINQRFVFKISKSS
jgi:putative flippase GtrA